MLEQFIIKEVFILVHCLADSIIIFEWARIFNSKQFTHSGSTWIGEHPIPENSIFFKVVNKYLFLKGRFMDDMVGQSGASTSNPT